MKSAFVSIVGRPSSGKSTLLNRMCGHKVSIVAPSPQTTRNAIRGIVTRGDVQLIFVDTPGFHTSERKFNQHMVDLIRESFVDVEAVLYLIDSSRPPGEEEAALRAMVTPLRDKLFVAFNKIDLVSDTRVHRQFIPDLVPAERMFELSAETGEGVERLLEALADAAPEGVHYYPEEFYTDQDPEFRAAEIIREQAINRLKQELPHSVFVDIADMELSENGERLWIRAFLLVERESQKGIVVGKRGAVVKEIRVGAQKELAALFPQKIRLDLQVKVAKEWRRNDHILSKLIR